MKPCILAVLAAFLCLPALAAEPQADAPAVPSMRQQRSNADGKAVVEFFDDAELGISCAVSAFTSGNQASLACLRTKPFRFANSAPDRKWLDVAIGIPDVKVYRVIDRNRGMAVYTAFSILEMPELGSLGAGMVFKSTGYPIIAASSAVSLATP